MNRLVFRVLTGILPRIIARAAPDYLSPDQRARFVNDMTIVTVVLVDILLEPPKQDSDAKKIDAPR